MAFGDLFLEDVRRYRETQMAGTGLEPALPALGPPTAALAEEMLGRRAARAAHLRRPARSCPRASPAAASTRALLAELPAGVDPCGENGEFHTFAWDGPMFRARSPCAPARSSTRDGFVFADLLASA